MTRLTQEEITAFLGAPPKQIARELSKFSRDARFFSSKQGRLLREHPNEWVGISGRKVRATAKSLDLLMSELTRKGFPPKESFISYVDASGDKLIL